MFDTGHDWSPAAASPTEDERVEFWLTKSYFQNDKNMPVMSHEGAKFFSAFEALLTQSRYLARSRDTVILTPFSHSPNIDMLLFPKYAKVDEKNKTVELDSEKYASFGGAVKMAGAITGELTKLDSGNPLLELRVGEQELGYSMHDLIVQRNIYERHSRL